jgi:hypothetical protein
VAEREPRPVEPYANPDGRRPDHACCFRGCEPVAVDQNDQNPILRLQTIERAFREIPGRDHVILASLTRRQVLGGSSLSLAQVIPPEFGSVVPS